MTSTSRLSGGRPASSSALNSSGSSCPLTSSGGAQFIATRNVKPWSIQRRASATTWSHERLGQRRHQTGATGVGQEGDRREQALGGVPPAHQRLHRDHLTGSRVDLGLVPRDELALADRGAQRLAPQQPQVGHAVLRAVEQQHAGAGLLRLVHRDVGAPQHLDGGGVGVLAHRDPYGGVQREVDPLDAQRSTQRCADLLRHLEQRQLVLARHHDRELVATEPRDQRLGTDHLADPVRECDEHLVTDGVAERVVDVLEGVHVQQQHRDRAAVLDRVIDAPRRPTGGSAGR